MLVLCRSDSPIGVAAPPVYNRITDLFIFAILALGLNVVVGYTGLLHLGIGAFFGIGAYITGIATVEAYPFQFGSAGSVIAATVGAGLVRADSRRTDVAACAAIIWP